MKNEMNLIHKGNLDVSKLEKTLKVIREIPIETVDSNTMFDLYLNQEEDECTLHPEKDSLYEIVGSLENYKIKVHSKCWNISDKDKNKYNLHFKPMEKSKSN